MQNLGEEAVNKRPRVDQHELADLYRTLAEQCALQAGMLLANEGMYLPSIKRFVKFATCDEKAQLKQLIEIADAKGQTVIDGAKVANFYHAIWHANMQRPVTKDEGIILLLIEPINNPLVEGEEFTWAGLLTEFTCVINDFLYGMLTRCSGFAPYLFYLATENKIEHLYTYESNKALPYYFRQLMVITRGRINACLTKFHCIKNNVALGTLLKAMAFRLEPRSAKTHFANKDTVDVYRDEGSFNYQSLLSCLTSKHVIDELAEVKPFPIQLKLPKKTPEVKPPVQQIVNQANFFAPVAPRITFFKEFDPQIIAEVMKLTEVHKTSIMYLLAQHLQSFNDIPQQSSELMTVRRAITQLRNWNDFIKRTRMPQWRELLSQAINSETYGTQPVECENTLKTLYQDLYVLPKNQLITKLMTLVYWIIINCDQLEQLNLQLSTVNNLKCQMEFSSDATQDFCLLKDLWFLLRGVKDQKERQRYLEIVLNKPELFSNQMPVYSNLAL